MTLVEEAASYLDGPGRAESRVLPRPAALAYSTESMRLTTRLMQVASWLLLQRAVNEGELTSNQAQAERMRVKLSSEEYGCAPEMFQQLPSTLRDLSHRSLRIQERVIHLDQSLVVARSPQPVGARSRSPRRSSAFASPFPNRGQETCSVPAPPTALRGRGVPGPCLTAIWPQWSATSQSRSHCRSSRCPLKPHPAARSISSLRPYRPLKPTPSSRFRAGARGRGGRLRPRPSRPRCREPYGGHHRASPSSRKGRRCAMLIENDARSADRLGADGVHVAGAGEDLVTAIKSLKPERIVGAGSLRPRDDAMAAGEKGADYVMFGEPHGGARTMGLTSLADRKGRLVGGNLRDALRRLCRNDCGG